MRFFPKKTSPSRSGFTLIEILIATSILLVIVVIASLVFQQMTGAYETGGRKMDSQVALRNVIGAVTRDLAMAVDSTAYPGLESVNDGLQGGSQITFLALTGSPGLAGEDGETAVRTAQVISYRFNGTVLTRTEQGTTCRNGKWQRFGPVTTSDLNDEGHPLSEFEFVVDGDDPVPDRVYIRAEIETEGKIAAVGAGSAGRNGRFESDDDKKTDDIFVGFNPNHAP